MHCRIESQPGFQGKMRCRSFARGQSFPQLPDWASTSLRCRPAGLERPRAVPLGNLQIPLEFLIVERQTLTTEHPPVCYSFTIFLLKGVEGGEGLDVAAAGSWNRHGARSRQRMPHDFCQFGWTNSTCKPVNAQVAVGVPSTTNNVMFIVPDEFGLEKKNLQK